MYAFILAALQIPVRDAVEKAAAPYMATSQTVAMSIGVLQDGKTSTYDFGVTDRSTKRPPNSHTRYFIGSITKTFTGLLLAKAVTEGKVSLEDDIRKYLPGSFPDLEFEGQPIRLWQMLNHTSGLPRDLPVHHDEPNPDFAMTVVAEQTRFDAYKEDDFLGDIRDVKLTRLPGVQFSYSNVAAQLLQLILERIYGKPFEALIKEKITGPLGMRDTRSTLTPHETARIPRAYSTSGAFIPASWTRFPAAGGLKSSTADMLRYIAWNIAEQDEAVRLAHQKAGTTVFDPNGNFYVGLNWQILKTPTGRMIFQNGGLPGFHSMCAFVPELKIGVIILTSEEIRPTPTDLSVVASKILQAIDPRSPNVP